MDTVELKTALHEFGKILLSDTTSFLDPGKNNLKRQDAKRIAAQGTPDQKREFLSSLKDDKLGHNYRVWVRGKALEVSGFYKKIKIEYESARNKYEGQMAKKAKGDLTYESSKKELLIQKKESLDSISAKRAEVNSQLKTEKTLLADLSEELYGTTIPHRPTLWKEILVWAGLAVVAFGEVPINYPVFQLFGEGRFLTYLAALLFGIVIAMLSHMTGVNLENGKKNRAQWISPVITVTMLVICYVVGYFRSRYVQTLGMEETKPYMMAVLNFIFFLAGTIWAYTMSDRVSHEKTQSYKTQWRLVATLESELNALAKQETIVNEDYSTKINSLLAMSQKKRMMNEETALNDSVLARKLAEELEPIEEIYKEMTVKISTFSKKVDESFKLELDTSKRILRDYFPDKYITGLIRPELNSEKVFLDEADRLMKKSQTSAAANILTSTVVIFLLFILSACSQAPQERHNIGVMVDKTENNAKLSELISADGIMKRMSIDLKNINESNGYGTVLLTTINENSVNPVFKVELGPMDADQTPVQRKKDLEKFKHELLEKISLVNSGNLGADNTSIYWPLCDMAKNLSQLDPEARKTIIIASDMIENYLCSFYKLISSSSYDNIRTLLEKQCPPPNLSGFEIIVVYSATDVRDDKRFRAVTKFWEYYIKKLGGELSVKGSE